MLALIAWITLVTGLDEPVDPPHVCTVVVEGMPRSAIASHPIRVGQHTLHVNRPRFEVEVRGPTEVKIAGPRYDGSVKLSTASCEGPVTLHARPRPVVLTFACAPRDMVVRCVNCPQPAGDRHHLPDRFPPLPYGSVVAPLRLELRAPGYHSVRRELVALPGANPVDARLDPL